MFIIGWIEPKIMVYKHSERLSSHKKEQSSDKCYIWMNFENKLSESSLAQKVTYWFHLYEISKIGQYSETESKLMTAGAQVRGVWGVTA